MAVDTVWASGFWATDFWADGFWASGVPAPVEEELKGGRRIYDPDDKEQKVKTRKLRKDERRAIDRMFAERVAPRYVEPRPDPEYRRRDDGPRPVVIDLGPGPSPDQPRVFDRAVAARQFLALDGLEAFLDQRESEAAENARAVEVLHLRAKQHARFLEAEQQRLAREAIQQEAARVEAIRVAEEQAEAFRLAEIQRIADEEEAEMIDVLLHVHNLP